MIQQKRFEMASFLMALTLAFTVALYSMPAKAQVDSNAFHQALKLKKGIYYQEGAVTGGDRNSSDFRITNIRIAPNPEGFDRVVIDLAGNKTGETAPLARPPYFQVEIDSVAKLTHVTLYGKPKLQFPTQSVKNSTKKAKNISSVELLPLVDQDRWTFTLHTKPQVKAEVFELSEPARIIIDFKGK